MPRKRNNRKPQGEKTAAPAERTRGTAHIHWVWVALVAGLLFGGTSGYFIGRAASMNDGGLLTDRYGRGPAHPHYMHNHP